MCGNHTHLLVPKIMTYYDLHKTKEILFVMVPPIKVIQEQIILLLMEIHIVAHHSKVNKVIFLFLHSNITKIWTQPINRMETKKNKLLLWCSTIVDHTFSIFQHLCSCKAREKPHRCDNTSIHHMDVLCGYLTTSTPNKGKVVEHPIKMIGLPIKS